MICISCAGKTNPDNTDYIEKNDNHVILIKDVPCEECEQCGEIYFHDNIVIVLERILDSIQPVSSEITLTVIDYVKNAA
jgi:YgiT-type zinc finger domain-containing protein